jgi:hypothetical protein
LEKPHENQYGDSWLDCVVYIKSGRSTNHIAEGLQFPQRLIFTPLGSLLVSEGGTSTPNTGRVSMLNRQGGRRSLLESLPAAPGHGITAFGPGGMGLNGRTLYLVIGEGNVMGVLPLPLTERSFVAHPSLDSPNRIFRRRGCDYYAFQGRRPLGIERWLIFT